MVFLSEALASSTIKQGDDELDQTNHHPLPATTILLQIDQQQCNTTIIFLYKLKVFFACISSPPAGRIYAKSSPPDSPGSQVRRWLCCITTSSTFCSHYCAKQKTVHLVTSANISPIHKVVLGNTWTMNMLVIWRWLCYITPRLNFLVIHRETVLHCRTENCASCNQCKVLFKSGKFWFRRCFKETYITALKEEVHYLQVPF